MENEKYTMKQLAQMTGLTDRTLRHYLAVGILEGEKRNGLWTFTDEQMDAFVRHKTVRPSILAKKHALVYDFLAQPKKRKEMCVVLDLPEDQDEDTAQAFCDAINAGDFENIRFSFDGIEKTHRIILKGAMSDVLQLLQQYCDHA